MCVNCDLDKLDCVWLNHCFSQFTVFSIHSQGEKIEVLGNFCWCEFHLLSPKLWEIRFLTLKMGGSTYTRVNTVLFEGEPSMKFNKAFVDGNTSSWNKCFYKLSLQIKSDTSSLFGLLRWMYLDTVKKPCQSIVFLNPSDATNSSDSQSILICSRLWIRIKILSQKKADICTSFEACLADAVCCNLI